MDVIKTYQLTQETPMVHFQSLRETFKSDIAETIKYEHGEERPTLRASDVKPKLDRFLLKQLGGAKAARETHKNWFVSKDQDALNYKLRFKPKGEPLLDEPHKLFFGNLGKDKEEKPYCKQAIIYPGGVEMTVVCFIAGLLEKIDELLPCFFALHAFGTRNSKGFGCFSVNDRELDIDRLQEYCPLKTYYTITYDSEDAPGPDSILNDIWIVSNMMKGGINFTLVYTKDKYGNRIKIDQPDDYYKGHIFRYFTNKEIGGDKAFVKQKVLTGEHDHNKEKSEEKKEYNEFRFVRALLGKPEFFKYKQSEGKTTRKGTVNIKSQIERFQSPVLFRVQGKRLFIIPQEIPQKMLNAKFRFNNKDIWTPKEFDFIDFLDSFMKRFNKKEEISKFVSKSVKDSMIIAKDLKIEKTGGA